MLVGAAVLVVGWAVGRISRAPRSDARPPSLICGCDHQLAMHDPQTNRCHRVISAPVWNDHEEMFIDEQVQCPCRQYTGDKPVDTYFSPRLVMDDDA